MTIQVRHMLIAATLAAGSFAAAAPAYADDAVYTSRWSNIAVQGYDPVAYFTAGAPIEGSKDYSTDYMGAEFRFASQANLDTFLADPAKYAPQYGGYCAWAIADGKYAKGNAKNWRIVDGKLYLNYNSSIQKKWDKDVPGFITSGDVQWEKLQGE